MVTRAGKLFVLLTLAVGFAAINTGSNLLHALFGAQMTLILASGVISDAMVGGVRIRRTAPAPLVAGDGGVVEVVFENRTRGRILLSLRCEDDPEAAGDAPIDVDPAYVPYLPPGGRVVRTVRARARRRGVHALPPAVVATRFPFGLFEKRRRLGPGAPALVYPTMKEGAQEAGDRGRPNADDDRSRGRRARHGAFFALREYRRGDEPRKIAWRASAHAGSLLVREEEARGLDVVTLHLSPGRTGSAPFEAAVARAAGAARRLLAEEGRAVELAYGPRTAVEAGTGPHQLDRILSFLATCGSSDDPETAAKGGEAAA